MVRRCDGCTVCCTLTRVPELNKPEGKTCIFACKGCTIYPDRPQSCRDFECEWLKGNLPIWMKPNKAHIMLEKLSDVDVVIALPEPGYEKNWRTPEITAALKKEYQDKGIAVMASDRLAMVPEGQSFEEIWNDVKSAARSAGVIK
jgi:hypothetical protein